MLLAEGLRVQFHSAHFASIFLRSSDDNSNLLLNSFIKFFLNLKNYSTNVLYRLKALHFIATIGISFVLKDIQK